ncbi:OmpA family protein [Baaleninema sp.]|uniref:OmpA family protein n=1 Tax=Baaleninema sp. TaxID=3101197 RepID=UPI003D082403
MSNSPPPNPSEKKESRRDRRRRQRQQEGSANPLAVLATLLFQLLVLVFCLGLGTVGGAFIAHFYPKVNPSEPLLEQWRAKLLEKKVPAAESSEPDAEGESSLPELTDEQRSLLREEFVQLKNELETLQTQASQLDRDNLTAAEVQAQQDGIARQVTAIETRIDQLDSLLLGETPGEAPIALPGLPLHLTLPSDILFTDSGTVLDPTSRSILDSFADELERLPNANVYISAYSNEGESEAIDLTFEQAKQVEQYFMETLNGEEYHWVSAGYGASQFAAPNDTAANRQRNRRIEIRVIPR